MGEKRFIKAGHLWDINEELRREVYNANGHLSRAWCSSSMERKLTGGPDISTDFH